MSEGDDDKPYVPKLSTKPIAEGYIKRRKRLQERTPNPPSQKERQHKYRRELKSLDIHKPKRAVTAQDVKTIKTIREYLSETWKSHWDKIDTFRKFTDKQLEFARQFALNGRSNRTDAVRRAGYDTNYPPRLLAIANKNLKRPGMEDLIRAFEIEEKARMKINVEDVVKWFNDIATAAMGSGDYTNANRAMENLAKYLGMFIEKKEIVHRTVHSKEELDARINELTAVLREADPDLDRKLRIN